MMEARAADLLGWLLGCWLVAGLQAGCSAVGWLLVAFRICRLVQ